MDITIYSTTTCSFCHALRGWLDSQNIGYTNKVTDTDPETMAEFMSKNDGMLSVPLTIIEKGDGSVEKIVGFDRVRIKAALEIA